MRPTTFALAITTACIGSAAWAGSATWTSEGPYGGHIYNLYVSPASPSTLYAATRGGVFRSNDGGVSWVRKQAGLTGFSDYVGNTLAMDADAPATLWLVDSFGRVNRSSDGGDNWAQTGYSTTPYMTNQLIDAPGSTGKLYLASATAGVLVSTDSGASFLGAGSGLPSGVGINRIAIDPGNPLHMIAGTADYGGTPFDPLHPDSLYLSNDGGATWTGQFGFGSYYATIDDLAFGAGGKVYALVQGTLYRSDDGGSNWSWTGSGGSAAFFSTVAADPVNTGVVFLGAYQGLFKTTDGGATSTPITTGLIVTAGMPATVNRIVLHPNYPTTAQLWLGTGEAGIYFSASGGASWTSRNNGLAGTQIRALAMFHDASTHRMFAGYGDAFEPSPALYSGDNTGPGTPFLLWQPANTNLGAYQIRSITIDPTTRSSGIGSTRLYATGRGGLYDFDSRDGGIYRSSDGGSTWTTIDAGLPVSGSRPAANVGTVRNLVLDPRSCAAPPPAPAPCTSGPLQTVYATSNGKRDTVTSTDAFRILKSTNGGNSWVSSDNGIPQPIDYGTSSRQSLLVVPIVIDPQTPQTLYVGTSANYDGSVVTTPTIQSGVFKSTNGGATWVASSTGLPRHTGSANTVYDVLTLAINPVNPLELWCSVIDLTGDRASGGIYHSTNGGATWSNSSNGIAETDIRAMYVDPTQPNVIYAAGGGSDANPGSVYKSSDSGATWHSISIGLPADSALALQVDPVDSSVLYAGTSSGVWSLTQLPDSDADGVPDAVENAAPNGGDGNGDGIADSQQSGVGSLTSASATGANQPALLEPYFTVAITPLAGQCTQAMDVQSVYAAYHGNDVSTYGDNYVYPRQLARFEIRDCQRARVALKFHGANFGAGYRMRFFGPATPGDPATLGWHDFSSRATQSAPDTWELTLDNGQFGSYRPASANAILFEGGPGRSEGIFRDGFD